MFAFKHPWLKNYYGIYVAFVLSAVKHMSSSPVNKVYKDGTFFGEC